MNARDINHYEKLWAQLSGTYDEVSLLSRKNPNDALNSFKLSFVNRLISDSNALLGKDYVPFAEFTAFDEAVVPQNSDVVFILSQYLECFEKLRSDNVIKWYGSWYWRISAEDGVEPDETDDDGNFLLLTVQPKKLREK